MTSLDRCWAFVVSFGLFIKGLGKIYDVLWDVPHPGKKSKTVFSSWCAIVAEVKPVMQVLVHESLFPAV